MQDNWDTFVSASCQGVFLFKRGYMDYHSDRFDDFSLVATERGRIVAALPANRVGADVYSHQGLTFGGWLTDTRHIDTNAMMNLWALMTAYLKSEAVTTLHYKPIPYIYTDYPAQEDRYALFRAGASLETCQVSSVIDLRQPVQFNENMRRNSAKARKAEICAGESFDYDTYWALLSEVLRRRHDAAPVHSADEIKLLAGRFDNIRLYTAHNRDGRMVAGVVIYASENVARSQYIAADDEGRDTGALAYLFERLIKEYSGYNYFDFGTSNEDGELFLNEGLIRQKSSMGGRAVTFDCFKIDL